MRRRIVWLSLSIVTVVAVALTIFFIDGDDIEVTVHNLGPETLENVVIGTDQASYAVGTIRRAKSAVIGIEVLGDSNLSVRHAGHPEWQTTDTYMTRGVTGRMSVMLEDGELVGFTSDIGP